MTSPNRPDRRLLLIEPPFYRLYGDRYALVRYPLSLAYLALAVRENTDWDVRVLNADFAPSSDPFDITYLIGEGYRIFSANLADPGGERWQAIRAAIEAYRPSVVGISVKSSSLASALRIAGMAKELDPPALVIAGGPHPSATGPEMLAHPAIDVCAVGEGEQTLVETLRSIETGASLAGVNGLFYRDPAGPAGTPRRGLLADLDGLGFPGRHARECLLDGESYPAAAFGHLYATRGCPHRCLFCGSREVWGRRTRFRSPRHVTDEIAWLRENMGISSFHFDDDTFGVKDAYLRALCAAMERHCPGIAWSCEIHVRLVKEENLARMKRAGCRMVQLGIESGSNDILARVRKGFTIEEALAAARMIARHGIRLHAFFMAGFPWDNEQTLRETKNVIAAMTCEKIIYSIFTPYPGTEAFRLCRAEGLIPGGYAPSLFGHQSPRNSFCKHLSPERFRDISRDIEETVVRKNRAGRQDALPDRQ